MLLPRAGKIYSFLYPVCNEVGVVLELTRRRALVRRVRYLKKEPLRIEDIIRRPMVNRGEILVEALDLDKDEERQYYWDFASAAELVLVNEAGQATAIKTGPSRYERLLFAELLARVTAPERMAVKPAA